MTRTIVLFGAVSAPVAYFDPLGYRWAGFAGLALLAAVLFLEFARWSRRRERRRTVEGLRALQPGEFEGEVARWLRRDGWRVEHRGGTGDGGIDILAQKRRETLAVQCKRYAETATVSSAQVRDLYGAAVASGATAAVLVTTGRVSAQAQAWAAALPGELPLTFHDRECLSRLARATARL